MTATVEAISSRGDQQQTRHSELRVVVLQQSGNATASTDAPQGSRRDDNMGLRERCDQLSQTLASTTCRRSTGGGQTDRVLLVATDSECGDEVGVCDGVPIRPIDVFAGWCFVEDAQIGRQRLGFTGMCAF